MDANKTRTVYIYDLSGKYINKISKYGQGPDEYLQLADLYIDPTDASLNVATRIDRKIMKFDLDGKQLRKVIGTLRLLLGLHSSKIVMSGIWEIISRIVKIRITCGFCLKRWRRSRRLS